MIPAAGQDPDFLQNVASTRARRLALAVAAVITLAALATLPFARTPSEAVTAFLPGYIAAVLVLHLLTALLFILKFGQDGRASSLALACAYLFTGLIVVPHVLAFPGVFSATGLLGAGPQTSVWLWVAWHSGFPALLLLHAALLRRERGPGIPPAMRGRRIALATAATALLVGVISLIAFQAQEALPVLIRRDDYHALVTSGVGPAALAVNVAALGALWIATRERSITHVWLLVATLASTLDVLVTLAGGARFSLGWYAARNISLLSAGAVLGAFIFEFQRIQLKLAQSEAVARGRAEALTRSEGAMRELYASLAEGIVSLAPDGTIEFLNPAAERIFGYPPGMLVGRNVGVLMPEKLREANAVATRRFLSTGASAVVGRRGLVFPALRRDGSQFDVEFSIAEMRQDSGTSLVAVVRDVSERTALDRMKSEFVAAVSHELRTPLTSIMGSLEILRESAIAEPERSFVEMAWRNSERLAALVNDVIDSERIASGALSFNSVVFPLPKFLYDAVQLYQSYAATHGVFFYLDEPVPAVMLRADRDRLMQVMANLLSNAAKFSDAGEEVRVRASVADGRVRVSVIDKGRGISEEFKPRVFQKFAQADASDARDKGGTGLGLAICHKILERLGGEIGFESRPGEGSKFWFELPVAGR